MNSSRAILIAIVVTVTVTLLLSFDAGRGVELSLRDLALRALPSRQASATAIVAIDEASIRGIGAWPWSRSTLADILDRIADAGARGAVLDILLPERRDGDDRLAQAMARIPTLAVSVLDEHRQWLLPALPLHDAAIAAHGNFEVDRDGIVRRFASTKQSGERSLTALSLRASSLITHAPVPVGQPIAPMFRTRPRMIPMVSAADVLRGKTPMLRGRLVFIGPTALGLGDRFLTPVSSSPDPGVTIHAAAAESVIRGETIHPLAPLVAGPIAGLMVFALLFAPSRRAALATASALLVIIAAGGIALIAWNGSALPFGMLFGTIFITTAAVETNRMRSKAARLEDVATRLAEHQAREVESKRLLVHELKTPLASMRNLTQLLADFDLTDAERRRVATLVESEAGKLQSMVHGLLDLERLPLRDFHAASSVVDLGDLLLSRVEFLRASTNRSISVNRERGLLVRGDSALIERIVDNLIANALKYTQTPVAASARRSGTDVLLEVEDHGPGIPLSERQRIFDRFYRGTSAAGSEGLGLGLAFVSEVAQWHGGGVSVVDAPGGGSLFRVLLPAAATAAKAGGI